MENLHLTESIEKQIAEFNFDDLKDNEGSNLLKEEKIIKRII